MFNLNKYSNCVAEIIEYFKLKRTLLNDRQLLYDTYNNYKNNNKKTNYKDKYKFRIF